MKPDQATLWLFAGTCQRELGLVGAAQTSFRQAIELNPRGQEARFAMGQLAQAGFGTRLGGWWKRHFGR